MSVRKVALLAALVMSWAVTGAISTAAADSPLVTTAHTLTLVPGAVLDSRTADGNTFLDQTICGNASFANGGSYSFCQTAHLILHPNNTWVFSGKGQYTGSYPGCGPESGDFEITGGGVVTAGVLVGTSYHVVDTGSSGTHGFHSVDTGSDFTSGTVTYGC
jgi:hypothetical protein